MLRITGEAVDKLARWACNQKDTVHDEFMEILSSIPVDDSPSIREVKELVEVLADLEHNRWVGWQEYLHSKCIKNVDGSLTIAIGFVNHWERQIKTKYKDLTEKEKESDRKEARRTVEAITKAIKEE